MPTSEEIVAFQERHPVKVYGVEGRLRDPYRLGDITVITFYDHEAAVTAAREQAIRDAIAAVETMSHEPCGECCDVDTVAALRALLVKGLKNSAETTDGAE